MKRSVQMALATGVLAAGASLAAFTYAAQRDVEPESSPEPAENAQALEQALEPPPIDTDAVSYALGYRMGNDLRQHGVEFNVERFSEGFTHGLEEAPSELDDEQIMAALISFQMRMQHHQQMEAQRLQREAEQFMQQNAQRDAVTVTDSGLQYEVIESGDGPSPSRTDRVQVHYEGRLVDGQVFDSSYERGVPATFPVNGVIAGWTEALQLMQVGDHWRLYIPAELAYGQHGQPAAGIGPNAPLIFEVELLSVEGQ